MPSLFVYPTHDMWLPPNETVAPEGNDCELCVRCWTGSQWRESGIILWANLGMPPMRCAAAALTNYIQSPTASWLISIRQIPPQVSFAIQRTAAFLVSIALQTATSKKSDFQREQGPHNNSRSHDAPSSAGLALCEAVQVTAGVTTQPLLADEACMVVAPFEPIPTRKNSVRVLW